MVEDEGQKLIFVFDYLTERSFFMELKEIFPGRSLVEPVCTMSRGKAPQQFIDMDDFEVKIDNSVNAMKEDLDLDDFYGDDQFDDDDLANFNDDLNLN